MKSMKIKLTPEVVEFIQSHANVVIESESDQPVYTLPVLKFKLVEGLVYEASGPRPERFFYISYNGVDINDNKTIIGHLAFAHLGFPSLLYITEVLIPGQSKRQIADVVLTAMLELNNEQDFNDFTIGRDMGTQLGDNIQLN